MPSPEPKTILVVDEFEPVCELIELLLCRVGYQVLKATTSAEALRLARMSPIDLLLSNLSMPSLHGDELAVRFASLQPSVPVVFLSSLDHPPELAGKQNVLFKPFTVAQLRDAVSRAIRRTTTPSGITPHRPQPDKIRPA